MYIFIIYDEYSIFGVETNYRGLVGKGTEIENRRYIIKRLYTR